MNPQITREELQLRAQLAVTYDDDVDIGNAYACEYDGAQQDVNAFDRYETGDDANERYRTDAEFPAQ